MPQFLLSLYSSIDLHMLIGIIFLFIILLPVIILFVILYQNLIETVRPRQKARQTRPGLAGRTRTRPVRNISLAPGANRRGKRARPVVPYYGNSHTSYYENYRVN